MRAVVQRVRSACVRVDGEVIGGCGKGLAVLAGAHRDDIGSNAEKMADRIWGLRIFADAEGKMNLALRDLSITETVGVLAVSNFTVYGETSKNRRPSFIEAAPFDHGHSIFECFVNALRGLGCHVETGEFGADMQVEVVNDGPVTVVVET